MAVAERDLIGKCYTIAHRRDRTPYAHWEHEWEWVGSRHVTAIGGNEENDWEPTIVKIRRMRCSRCGCIAEHD